MPARGREDCRKCSKLNIEQVLQKHGVEGDGCYEWDVSSIGTVNRVKGDRHRLG